MFFDKKMQILSFHKKAQGMSELSIENSQQNEETTASSTDSVIGPSPKSAENTPTIDASTEPEQSLSETAASTQKVEVF